MLKDFAADLEKSPVLKVCLYEHLHYNIYIFNILLTYRQVETERQRETGNHTYQPQDRAPVSQSILEP